jgi:hypothetical protein
VTTLRWRVFGIRLAGVWAALTQQIRHYRITRRRGSRVAAWREARIGGMAHRRVAALAKRAAPGASGGAPAAWRTANWLRWRASALARAGDSAPCAAAVNGVARVSWRHLAGGVASISKNALTSARQNQA